MSVDIEALIEQSLGDAVQRARGKGCPTQLAAALEYAVFPGGARVRPKLCMAVAAACETRTPETAMAAASAIELLHCASLVHDDLPCFDDAETRRGKPSVHRAFDERIAVLTGDALIILAFETLALRCAGHAEQLVGLTRIVAAATGGPMGICAGQAWECEPEIPLEIYEHCKTGVLFAAATSAGALASGAEPDEWRAVGDRLGEAFQIADDICDALGTCEELGKPAGQDEALDRPSYTREYGVDAARALLEDKIAATLSAVPECPGQAVFREQVKAQSARFIPASILSRAA